ncbi:MAG: Druantia anti-phage system protein DruA [Clostridia bacterium]
MNTPPPEPRMLSVRYCGRDFTLQDLAVIRAIIAAQPHRAAIARAVCQEFNWLKPDGGLKDASCALALRRMHADGWVELPPPVHRPPAPPRAPTFTAASDPQSLQEGVRGDLGPLQLRPVVQPAQSRLWNELVARYHYAGYSRLPGAQLRYLVFADDRLLAALGFSAAAWRLYDRDAFVGWSDEQRAARLHLVANLARFLILPWVRIKFLASSILAQAARQLPGDWQARYAYPVLLLETFVECDRFAGTCFRAANWTCVGETVGRGKRDRIHNRPTTSFKSIWLRPLAPDFRQRLCAPDPPAGGRS